jgi:hypothetical protein
MAQAGDRSGRSDLLYLYLDHNGSQCHGLLFGVTMRGTTTVVD